MKYQKFNKKSKKKAELELQINWIFIIVIGALIILFFTGIVIKQKKVSTLRIEAELTKNIYNLIAISQTTSNAFHKIQIPRSKIYFQCPDCLCGISISTSLAPTKMQDKSLFMNSQIDDSIIYLWTKDNNIGFKVNNFIYLSTPNIQYVIIQNISDSSSTSVASKIYSTLKENFNTILINYTDLDANILETNYAFYRLIFSFANPIIPDSLKTPKISALSIDTYSEIKIENTYEEPYGNLTFYTLDSNQFVAVKSLFINSASLYGAIFSNKKENYECSLENSFEKLRYVSNIYISKINEFENAGLGDIYYSQIKSKLNSLIGIDNFNESIAEILIDTQKSLSLNNNYLFRNSKPTIY